MTDAPPQDPAQTMLTLPDAEQPPRPAMSAGQVRAVRRAQERTRRLRFWAGALAIVVVGGLWAGLTKDPPRDRNNGFGDIAVAEDVAFAVEAMPAPIPLPPPDGPNFIPAPTPTASPEFGGTAVIDMGDPGLAPGESFTESGFLGEYLEFSVPVQVGQQVFVEVLPNIEVPVGLEIVVEGGQQAVTQVLTTPDGASVSYVADEDGVVSVRVGGFGPPIPYEVEVSLIGIGQ